MCQKVNLSSLMLHCTSSVHPFWLAWCTLYMHIICAVKLKQEADESHLIKSLFSKSWTNRMNRLKKAITLSVTLYLAQHTTLAYVQNSHFNWLKVTKTHLIEQLSIKSNYNYWDQHPAQAFICYNYSYTTTSSSPTQYIKRIKKVIDFLMGLSFNLIFFFL